MPDWKSSMQRTYEYYMVDPVTWKDTKRIDTIKSSSINWDSEAETLGSASIDISDSVGECYIRIYMITIQNGVKEKRPLGTFLTQTPSSTFNGKIRNVTIDAYTPLIELKEKLPPIGYFPEKDADIGPLKKAGLLMRDNKLLRAPVIISEGKSKFTSFNDEFVYNGDDTWLKYLSEMIAIDEHKFDVNEMGQILFAPNQDIEAMQPVWTYDDGNSSILLPEITMNHDLYGIPNVLEVVYSTDTAYCYAIVKNNDPSSPTSIQNRGREIVHRVMNPDYHDVMEAAPDGVPIVGASNEQIKAYAEKLLKKMSTVEYSVSYTHAYCPVRVGDCVRLNYERAGLVGIKAKVISQSISCTPDCPVSEKAVFTTSLWR